MQQKLGAAILILALSLASARSAASDDILAFVRDRHIRTGQCRIQCVRQLAAAPRDSDCQRRRSCRGCWDLCPELATSVGRRNLESRCGSGDIGSGPACGYFFDDDDDQVSILHISFLKAPNYVQI
jgi:hypothetical protein